MADELAPDNSSEALVAAPPRQPTVAADAAAGITPVLTTPIAPLNASQLNAAISIQPGAASADALINKLQPEHVTLVIEESAKDSLRKTIERLVEKILGTIVALSCLTMVFAICYLYLINNKAELAQPIVNLVLGFVGGGVGGYGLGRQSAKRKEDQ
jgi:hypothetical protein